ncbi:type I methionyl aminopeptidase [Euzebya tangerina]|uniref:type I methionyl aminopeptidase n=1 Tax=Euzebya tangerina TaxID=591198 RepID=UPI000E30BCF5|nr:type I methionyl aminopeptidase [Euzebya tangerina]
MIIRKSPAELEIMARSGKIIADMHELVAEAVKPGVSTGELDRLAEDYIRAQNAVPAFLGYGGDGSRIPFPGTLCASVNDEIVHGIPSRERILEEGDLFKVDAGCVLEGYYSDSACTWMVGGEDAVPPEVAELVRVTREGLWAGLVEAKVKRRIGDISSAVQRVGERFGYGIVQEYVGHGVGRSLHEDPQVPNHGRAGRGPKMAAGLVLAVEPMFNLGTEDTVTLEDEWTVVTADGGLSAHWEHTVAITPDGPWVLTARSDETAHPLQEPSKIPVALAAV